MNQKDFLQTVLKPRGEVFQDIIANRSNPLIDYTYILIEQELKKHLKDKITEKELNKLGDEILDILVDLSDYSAKIGIDTASMLLAGIDPFNTYTKMPIKPEQIRKAGREIKKHLASDQTKTK